MGRLTVVGAARERSLVTGRGRWKTVSARVADQTLLGANSALAGRPSTSAFLASAEPTS